MKPTQDIIVGQARKLESQDFYLRECSKSSPWLPMLDSRLHDVSLLQGKWLKSVLKRLKGMILNNVILGFNSYSLNHEGENTV